MLPLLSIPSNLLVFSNSLDLEESRDHRKCKFFFLNLESFHKSPCHKSFLIDIILKII